MNGEWARAYPPSAGRWGVIAWEAAGLAYLQWTTVRLFELGSVAAWLLAVTFGLAWAVGSWQVARMGLYLSDAALRIRGVFRTRTVPWSAIGAVSVEDVAYWRIPAGRAVVLTLRDGTRLNTSLWERGMDFHGRPQMFRSVCRDLRRRI
ncbi:PH domain-containing protein [Actinoplanes bogorensis]|uniref:PH domain-containing protein n=1 Tax=Paractinoplanes bogorensis TaxID=1610840 RepID=A0ABS5Z5J8_9ACTN|nr:PH domain-containing protein [Actinoplanes bogorensis]MBU2670973.1 PH domain-containing protein [Actinoplanes bogorensis]